MLQSGKQEGQHLPSHPRSPAPNQQQSWVPDAAMGSKLLFYVTLSSSEQVSPEHSVEAPEMSLLPWDRSLVMRAATGGFPVLCPQLPSVSFPTGLVDSGVIQTPKFLIKSRKQQVTLRCSPEPGHHYVSWYRPWDRAPSSLFSIMMGKCVPKGTCQIDSQVNSSVTLALR